MRATKDAGAGARDIPPAGWSTHSADPQWGRVSSLRAQDFQLNLFVLSPGFESGEHEHRCDAVVVPLGGELIIQSQREHTRLTEGVVALPAGVPHRERVGHAASCLLIKGIGSTLAGLRSRGVARIESAGAAAAAQRVIVAAGDPRPEGWWVGCLVAELCIELDGTELSPARLRGGAPGWLLHVRDQLLEEYVRPPTLDGLAREAGVTREHLVRTFRRCLGRSIGDFVRRRRALRALELLRQSGRTLTEISLAAGYADQSHMTRELRRHLGVTPGTLRGAMASRRPETRATRDGEVAAAAAAAAYREADHGDPA